jgi:hypothetical protein
MFESFLFSTELALIGFAAFADLSELGVCAFDCGSHGLGRNDVQGYRNRLEDNFGFLPADDNIF